jgi:predicted anti-sigma-YlaC factor YlaD
MTNHVTRDNLERFSARVLAASELCAIWEHLETCAACHQLFTSVLAERRAGAVFSLERTWSDWVQQQHFSEETLLAYAEHTLDPAAAERASAHLQNCSQCRAEWDNFQDLRQAIQQDLLEEERRQTRTVRPVWPGKEWLLRWRPATALATVFLLGVVLAITLWLSQSSRQQPVQPPVNLGQSPTRPIPPATSPGPVTKQKPVEAATTAQAGAQAGTPSHPVASPQRKSSRAPLPRVSQPPGSAPAMLHDGAHRIRLANQQSISGVPALTPALQETAQMLLFAQASPLPAPLAELIGGGGPVRGGNDEPAFQVLSPLGVVLAEDRPAFRWEPLAGADTYQVYLSDHPSRPPLRSPQLPAGTTQWTPPRPLQRGAVYTWAVGAVRQGKEVIAPVITQPEARFKLISEAQFTELQRLQKTQSQFALGLFYTHAGMLAEAEQCFQRLLAENPRSPVLENALRQLAAWQTESRPR